MTESFVNYINSLNDKTLGDILGEYNGKHVNCADELAIEVIDAISCNLDDADEDEVISFTNEHWFDKCKVFIKDCYNWPEVLVKFNNCELSFDWVDEDYE